MTIPVRSTAVELPTRREVPLDVRDDLRQGKEPFSRIMAAIGALGPDEMLCLRAIFEPVPLYAVLAKRGFAHWTECRGAEDWLVWFWHGARPTPAGAPMDVSASTAAATDAWLDVRGLEPPEPMVRTLAALESLPAGHTLVQVNGQVPQFLLPILSERGFAVDIDDSEPGRVLVRIRRQ